MTLLNEQLRAVRVERIYRNYRVYRMSVQARRVVESLFQSYLEFPRQLPPGVVREDRGLHRSVCDHVAGMTDREAFVEHHRLFGSHGMG
jgi:dGTPase